MDVRFKSILRDLAVSFTPTLFFKFLEEGFIIDLSFFTVMFKKYDFYLIWLVLFILVFLMRYFIHKNIDKKQDFDFPSSFFASNSNYAASIDFNYLGFSWKLYFDYRLKNSSRIKRGDKTLSDVEDVDVVGINGPFCPNDKREMEVIRNYWGIFKYKCPKCKYKKFKTKNKTTLENESIDEFKSDFR